MFINFNKLLYKLTFKLFDYEGIKVLIDYDTRDKSLILNDLFHVFYNEENDNNSATKNIFINKIKNKELNIPFIDDIYIKILKNIDDIYNNVIDLIQKNDITNLKLLFMKYNMLISYINHDGFDLLIYTINNNTSIDMIKYIISLYKSLNYCINKNNTISLNSIIENSIDTLMDKNNNTILKRVLYLNKILNEYECENESNCYTPLYCAIINNKFSIANILLKNGANMNYKFDKKHLLYNIIENEDWNKQNLKFIFHNDYSYINSNEFITFITQLIKKNKCKNELLNIIMQYYIKNVSFILKLLFIYKDKVKFFENQWYTLLLNENSNIPMKWLIHAIDMDNLDIVKILMNHGIYINKKINNENNSPLFKALKFNSVNQYYTDVNIDKNKEKIISCLIKNNVYINDIDEDLIVYAIKRNSENIVKDLINYSDIKNYKCRERVINYINVALKTGRDEIIKYLIEYVLTYYNKNEILQDSNLITLSIENCNEDITKFLIEKGTKIDNKICIADAFYMYYSDTIIKHLIEHGADVNKKGYCNEIPLIIAIENRNENMIEFLLDHGAIDESSNTEIISKAVENSINIPTIQKLINHNIKINECLKKDLSRSLKKAIKINDETLVKMLVNNGADVNFNNIEVFYNPFDILFEHKNENIIKIIFENGINLNNKLIETTPLTYVLNDYNEPFIKYIIDKGTDVNYKDDINKTPLYYAISNCSETIIRYLIDHGATSCTDVNIVDACYRKLSEPIIQYLLDHGANLNSYYHGYGPLMMAIKNNYSDSIIKSMIDHGANINEKVRNACYSSDRCCPLKLAAEKKRLNIIQYLLDHGADINVLKRTKERPFIINTKKNNEDIETFLMKQSININNNYKNNNNNININNNNNENKNKRKNLSLITKPSLPLLSLLESSPKKYDKNTNEILMKYIIRKNSYSRKRKKKDIDINEPNNRSKRKKNNDINLSEYLIEALENNYNEIIIRSLIDQGADVKNGLSLIKAIENNYSEKVIQSLLEQGADVNVKNKNSKSPLELAFENSNEIVIKMLVDYGADVNKEGINNQYPINISIINFNETIVQYLIDHGAKVRNDTPLYDAIEKNFNEDLILFLIEHGANIKKKTILNRALENNYSNTVLKSLIDHGVNITCDDGFNEESLYYLSESSYIYKDVKIKKNIGMRLLYIAIKRHNEELIRYIIEHGLNNITELIDYHNTPLSQAIIHNCSLNLIKFLIEHTDVQKFKKLSFSIFLPQYLALQFHNIRLVEDLDKHGYNIFDRPEFINEDLNLLNESKIKYLFHQNSKYLNNEKYNLMNVITMKIYDFKKDNKLNSELIKYFINHKVINRNYYNDLLKIAIDNKNQDLIEYLIHHELPLKTTTLNYAIENRNFSLVKVLKDYGADLNTVDKNNH